jgi:serine/threonine protein phosphatase PrpC
MLEAFGLSDQGCVRANNEDYFIVDASAGIFVLADGMGGERAGECASRLSAEMIYHYLLEAPGSASHSDIGTIEHGFRTINTVVYQAAEDNSELRGMGTTLVVARVVDDENKLQIGSVGDSRAYLLSDGLLSLLTQDHTWVDEIGVPLGLTDEELRHHPMKHVLTMAIGTSQELRVHSSVTPMAVGDQVLLCSDGLHGVVLGETLEQILKEELPAQEKCRLLVETAKRHGGPDNVTVVLINRL